MVVPSVTNALPAMTGGNKAKLLTGDAATYAEAIKLIDSATESIQFETFTFNGDQGRGMADALIRAAQRGVTVQVMLDTKAMFVGDQGPLARQMLKGGVDVRHYRERSLSDPAVAIDHAKLLVINGKTALVGGTNFDRRVNFDFNYELQGPAVPRIQDMFTQSWEHSKALVAPGARPGDPAPVRLGYPLDFTDGDTDVGLSETAPKHTTDAEETRPDVLTRIKNATTSIDLLMYNIDDKEEIQALIDARKRGVKVRVILNHETGGNMLGQVKDQVLNLNMAAVQAFKANDIAVRWFVLPPGTDEMHAKVAVFDGDTVLGGSTNWVHSSNYDNHELAIWLRGPIAGSVEQKYQSLWDDQTSPIRDPSWGDNLSARVSGFLSRFI